MTIGAPDTTASGSQPRLRIVGRGAHRLWGLTQEERLKRAFTKAGAQPPDTAPGSASVVLVRADMELEPSLIKNLVDRPGVALSIDGAATGAPEIIAAHVESTHADDLANIIEKGSAPADQAVVSADLTVLSPGQLASAYNPILKKREPTYAFSLRNTPVDEVEARTFAGSYKGVTDFVTKYVWPKPAKAVTRWAAEQGITPNAVTTVSLVLVLIAMALFYYGYFLTGLVAAWVMTFLDTVDGKLARVTMTSSPWGNVYDHGIDLIHPPFWWWAWWVGLAGMAQPIAGPLFDQALYVILGGYVVGRMMEAAFNVFFGVALFLWRPIDSAFRLITTRRNPNLVLLTLSVLFGVPDLGFLAVAAWTAISIAFHFVRLLQAAALRISSGKALESWLATQER